MSRVTDVYTLLKDDFKDILQEIKKAEVDVALGDEKNQKGDSHVQLQDLCGIEMSTEMACKIMNKIFPKIREWQSRPLNLAAYVVLGVTTGGTRRYSASQ